MSHKCSCVQFISHKRAYESLTIPYSRRLYATSLIQLLKGKLPGATAFVGCPLCLPRPDARVRPRKRNRAEAHACEAADGQSAFAHTLEDSSQKPHPRPHDPQGQGLLPYQRASWMALISMHLKQKSKIYKHWATSGNKGN